MAARKRKTTRSLTPTGKKLVPTIKKQGLLKGSGMYEAKHTNEDVLSFWEKNNFDLKLPVIDGRAVAGNCDLCFLKGTATTLKLLHERPELADWWIEKETIMEKSFRHNRPNYISLVDLSKETPKEYIDDEQYTCFCHD